MALDKVLKIYDEQGNPVDYDILASDVKFLPDGKDLPTKLTEMEDAIEDAAESGGYEPPEGGIPKEDLQPSVQTSLGLADTALQAADKTQLQNAINSLQSALDTLIGSGNVQGAIDTFNEVVTFLNGINSSDTLAAKLALKANDADVVKSVSVNNVEQTKDTNGNVNIQVQAGGESIVFDTEGTPIIDSPLSANADTTLGAASARWVKEIDNNVKAILAALAGIAFTSTKPTWQTVAKRKYNLTMTALTGCTGEVVSGDAGNGQVYEGGVRIKLTPTAAYTFASIKVNGEDVSSTPTGDSDNSVYIDIIANQDITVSATAVSGFAIAVSGSHVTNTQSHSGSTYTVTLGSDNQHFHLPDTIVVKHGQTVLTVNAHYTYNKTTGEVVISNVNDGTYSIEVTMVEDAKYNVALDATGLTGATAVLSASQVYAGENATITITPNEGYTLDSVKYAINSGSQQDATISNNQAVITLSNINEHKSVVVTGSASIPTELNLNLKWFEEPSNPTITEGQPFSLELVPLTDFVAAATQDAGTENAKPIRAAVEVLMNGTDITNNTGVVTFDETNNKVTINIANPSGSVTINAKPRLKMKRNHCYDSLGNYRADTNLCCALTKVPFPEDCKPVKYLYYAAGGLVAAGNSSIFYKEDKTTWTYWSPQGSYKKIDTEGYTDYFAWFKPTVSMVASLADQATIDTEHGDGTQELPYFDAQKAGGDVVHVLTYDDFHNALYID